MPAFLKCREYMPDIPPGIPVSAFIPLSLQPVSEEGVWYCKCGFVCRGGRGSAAPLCSFRSSSSRCTKPKNGRREGRFNSHPVLKARGAQTDYALKCPNLRFGHFTLSPPVFRQVHPGAMSHADLFANFVCSLSRRSPYTFYQTCVLLRASSRRPHV